MKKLTNLVKNETLNVEGLMMIKGGAAPVGYGCSSSTCVTDKCLSSGCISNVGCISFACTSGACDAVLKSAICDK